MNDEAKPTGTTATKKVRSKRKSAPITTPEKEPVGEPKPRRRRGDLPFWP